VSGQHLLDESNSEPQEAIGLLGECHPLLEQLGSADGLFTLSGVAATLRLPKVDSLAALARFLEAYQSEVLLTLDLPAIYRAHHHACHNQARELVALDLEMALQGAYRDFASASRRVGRSQLRRLRPLRGERIVQRYLQAVEQERAQAWHTLVYGLTLAIYSLPVRQGLFHYARQTLRGFIQAAARPLRLSAAECSALLEKLCAALPGRVETILGTVI
jgi:urease accessory protein UreF